MSINWKVRLKNINFWLAVVPAVLLLVQVVAVPFGYQWDFTVLNQQLAAIINAAFALLAILGVVTDPTTKGLGDSAQALTYTEPKATEGAVDTAHTSEGV
ncbi:MAG: phage holin [Atopobium sp.]|nr:phage holin [Atopobium sp.]